MKYSRDLIERILSKADIINIISKHVKLKPAGHEFKGCCPFHKEKTPSFSVNPQKNVYYCFGCHAKGNAIDFLCHYENLSFEDALQTLSTQTGITLPTDEQTNITTKYNKVSLTAQKTALPDNTQNSSVPPTTYQASAEGDLYQLLNKINQYYQYILHQSPAAKDYFLSRGLSEKTIAKFELGYAPNQWHNLSKVFAEDIEGLKRLGLVKAGKQNQFYDFFRDRVMFPIKNHRGQVVGFSGRALNDNDKPKYMNSSESDIFHKQEFIYGFYEAREARAKEFLVVEGYMDVIALYQSGIFGAVAAMGTAISEQQIASLLRYHDNLKFCFDGDEAGKNASWKALLTAAPLLHDKKSLAFVTLPPLEDPDSFIKKYGKQAMQTKIDEAKQTSSYIYDILVQEFGTKSPEAKTKIYRKAKEFTEKLPNGSFRGLLNRDISNKLYSKDSPSFRQPKSEQIDYNTIGNSNELDLCRYILYAPYILKEDPLQLFINQIQTAELSNKAIQNAKKRLNDKGEKLPSLPTWETFNPDIQFLVAHIKNILEEYQDEMDGINLSQSCTDKNQINHRAHFIIATLPNTDFKDKITKLWYEFFEVNLDKERIDSGVNELLCNHLIQLLDEEQKLCKNNILISTICKGRQEILKRYQRKTEYFTQDMRS